VTAIVDTGPLVAFFNRSERHHHWAVEQLDRRTGSLLVCEPVLTEAWHLLSRFPRTQEALLELVASSAIRVAFALDDNVQDIVKLVMKYRDTPMSLADACVVRMAEIHARAPVLTLDSDFLIYRRRDRSPLEVIHPSMSP